MGKRHQDHGAGGEQSQGNGSYSARVYNYAGPRKQTRVGNVTERMDVGIEGTSGIRIIQTAGENGPNSQLCGNGSTLFKEITRVKSSGTAESKNHRRLALSKKAVQGIVWRASSAPIVDRKTRDRHARRPIRTP